jgi:hypothetical protein
MPVTWWENEWDFPGLYGAPLAFHLDETVARGLSLD